MKIKSKLYIQDIFKIAVTILVAAVLAYCLKLVFGLSGGVPDTVVLINENGRISDLAARMSETDAKALYIQCDSGRNVITFKNERYSVKTQGNPQENKAFVLTHIRRDEYWIFAEVMFSFILAYLLCSVYTGYKQRELVFEPIQKLLKITESICEGNIKIPVESYGEYELAELFDNVEKMRIKLLDAVNYCEKYDDNRKFLMTGISHDLRTPIAAARGYIEGILDGVAGESREKQDKYLHAALSKIESVNELIDDLMLYSKLDVGKIPFEPCPVDLNGYIASCAEEYAPDFEKEGKRLIYENKTENAVVLIDPMRFKRVIQNIVGNAMKHTESGTGEIKFILRENAGSVICEISDNGAGIPEKDLPHIFERFYKGEIQRSGNGSSGLGLTIAKQLTEGMDGRIWAVSREGRGASFMISFKKYSGGNKT